MQSETKETPLQGTVILKPSIKRFVGRNDPCPCGSGKKFKKCCIVNYDGGQYKGTVVNDNSVDVSTK